MEAQATTHVSPTAAASQAGYLAILVHNYGGRRKREEFNAHIQRDLEESTSTFMCIQEADTEFHRDDAWFVLRATDTCLVTAARKSAAQSLFPLRDTSHLDGTNTKKQQCFTEVQISRVILTQQNTLSRKQAVHNHELPLSS